MRWRARFPRIGLGAKPARGLLGLVLLVAGLWLGCGQTQPQTAARPGGIGPPARATCDLYAATGGSHSAPGSRSRPFQTAHALARALHRGQTGCFRRGIYSFSTLNLRTRGVTLAPYRDEEVTLQGAIKVLPGGAGSTIQGMTLEGRGADNIGPRIYADDVVVRDNEITNQHTDICVQVGSWYDGPPPEGVVIERNRIHDCGELPSTNMHHGIYLSEARDAIVRDNWIYDNADRGIQLYPDADGSTITGNAIDSNGEGIVFAGEGSNVSTDNLVAGNVVSNSNLGWNVYSNPSGSPAHGNVLRHNCLWAGDAPPDFASDGGVDTSSRDFTSNANSVVDPLYVDRDAHDYTLSPESECPLAGEPGFPALNEAGVRATSR